MKKLRLLLKRAVSELYFRTIDAKSGVKRLTVYNEDGVTPFKELFYDKDGYFKKIIMFHESGSIKSIDKYEKDSLVLHMKYYPSGSLQCIELWEPEINKEHAFLFDEDGKLTSLKMCKYNLDDVLKLAEEASRRRV